MSAKNIVSEKIQNFLNFLENQKILTNRDSVPKIFSEDNIHFAKYYLFAQQYCNTIVGQLEKTFGKPKNENTISFFREAGELILKDLDEKNTTPISYNTGESRILLLIISLENFINIDICKTPIVLSESNKSIIERFVKRFDTSENFLKFMRYVDFFVQCLFYHL